MMKYMNLIMKVICLAAVIGILISYQNIAVARAAAVEERNSEIAEVEVYNAQILAAQQEEQSKYQDGTYEGSGDGFGGQIQVSVSIEDGKITDVEILSADGEDSAYFDQAVTLVDDILKEQSAEVDAVSGATFSSEGIKAAVAEALKTAEGN